MASHLFVTEPVEVQASKDATVHVLEVDAPFDSESTQAREGVTELRDTLVPAALRGRPRRAVGGGW